MVTHPVNQIIQVGFHGFSLPGGPQFVRHSAQHIAPLYQIDLEALVGNAQRRLHTGNPTAYHHHLLDHLQPDLMQGFDIGGFGHGHSDQVLGFGRCPFRIVHVNPGVLVTNVGHFEQVLVQTRIPDCLLEQRLMRSGENRKPPPHG